MTDTLIIICALAAMLNVLAYLVIRIGISGKKEMTADENRPVSVLIAARNEEKNLKRFLPDVLRQEYPEYEVLVILDRCTDGSEEILRGMQEEFSHLRWIKIDDTPDGWSPKKYALNQGILDAKYDLLVFTDADCSPRSQWLRKMGEALSAGADIVIGLSPYLPRSGFLNGWVRYEAFHAAFLYTGATRLGLPYMATGRSFGYHRDIFHDAGGYDSHKGILSGDDDLFLHALQDKKKIIVIDESAAAVDSKPVMTWKRWIRQKLRHTGASVKYKPQAKAFLTGFHGIAFIFYVTLILGLLSQTGPAIFLYIWLLRTVLCMIMLMGKPVKVFGTGLVAGFAVYDLLQVLHNLLLAPAGMIRKQKNWE